MSDREDKIVFRHLCLEAQGVFGKREDPLAQTDNLLCSSQQNSHGK